jgi:hypothetical protein
MSNLARFAAYAAAFEQSYVSGEWSDVEAYFAPDAVYEVGLPLLGTDRCDGRGEILAWFPTVLSNFDQRFETRELTLLDGPIEKEATVWLRGRATYRAAGVPDLNLELEETLHFEEGLIVRLEDVYTPEMQADCETYLRAHGQKLGIDLVS